MNARQKKFILEKLIPFLLREQGRGFAMSTWKEDFYVTGDLTVEDGLERIVPRCGMVCCLGGSIQTFRPRAGSSASCGKVIGLNYAEAIGLFYGWIQDQNYYKGIYGWPQAFRDKFAEASTPYRKAQVACSLLKKIVKDGPQILRRD